MANGTSPYRDRTISLTEPDFHSSESDSGRLLNHCQGLYIEEAKSFNPLGLKYDLNNARLHSLSA